MSNNKDTEQECLPISKLEDVWLWKSENSRKWSTTPLQPSTDYCYQGTANSCHVEREKWKLSPRLDRSSAPKTLLCHDMKGGYLGDRFVNGTQNSDEYRFFHWAGIDIFVYFSHHLITIPPPMWINAAHLHGVKILGTFITEWKDGEKICQEILMSHENINEFTKKLVSIANHYGFDGWLVNIENKISEEVGKVHDLVMLVDKLRNEMHQANTDSLVIWYDSVTSTDGKLNWQNELNSHNSNFFDHSDGIFLNYTWNEENLKTSKSNAQDRPHNVYVGIDVFGRNFYEGGGFNTHKALEVARKYGLSIAIFAPGWVHETFGSQDFTANEYYFWNTIRPHLFLHGPNKLPFQTSFCQGAGIKKYYLGKEVSSGPWFDLSLQQYQPCTGSCRHMHLKENKAITCLGLPGCTETYMDDAFNGGNSLILCTPNIKTTNPEDGHPSSRINGIQRILICGFFCDMRFLVSVASKKLDANSEFGIILKVKSLKGKYSSILLQENEGTDLKCTKDVTTILPADELETERLKKKYDSIDALKYSHGNVLGENWIMRNYIVNHPQVAIVEIGVLMQQGSVLLGFLSIQELRLKVNAPITISFPATKRLKS